MKTRLDLLLTVEEEEGGIIEGVRSLSLPHICFFFFLPAFVRRRRYLLAEKPPAPFRLYEDEEEKQPAYRISNRLKSERRSVSTALNALRRRVVTAGAPASH